MRCLLAYIAIASSSRVVAIIYHVLSLNNLLGVAALIMVHVYRLSASGRFCSGDFTGLNVSTPGYLVERGKLLLGLVIYSWVGLFCYSCVIACILKAA